ncbi:MAG: RDD family protein [Candidatus Thiodiazotropha sp.]
MNNPYQTPNSKLVDQQSMDELDSTNLASRGSRLLAILIDALIGMLLAIPFWLLTGSWDYVKNGQQLPFSYTVMGVIYGFIGFALVHYYFLNKNGQTIGKTVLGIKIVALDNNLTGANHLLLKRYLPMSIVSAIPVAGSLLMLVDSLFIFRKNKRCVHDLIAGTKVVKK